MSKQYKDYKTITKLLAYAKKIIVTSHINPDGDAVGSAIALSLYLKQKGFETNVVIPNSPPEFLMWLPAMSSVFIYEKKKKQADILIENADLIFNVDVSRLERLQHLQNAVAASKAKKIIIDHHPEPSDEFDAGFSDIKTSSTAELVFDFIMYNNDEHLINKSIAECLFAGIMTDTGSFSYACNRAETFKAVTVLIEKGINIKQIHNNIYDTFSENRLRLLGHSISQRLEVYSDFKTAIIWLSKEDLKKHQYQAGDTEGIVNEGLSINGIEISIFIAEREKHLKMSFRSKGNMPVNLLAKQFNGGGHINAAGGKSFKSLIETIEEIKEKASAFYQEFYETDSK